MRRRGFLTLIPTVGLTGCVSVNIESSDESDPDNDTDISGDGNVTVEEVDATERPIIHDMSLQTDDEWLMINRRYEVPNPSVDSFIAVEHWYITDVDGGVVLDREQERTFEPDRDTETVVESSMWFVNRWNHNIQPGEYTVELVVVGPQGGESDPERRTITITSDLGGENDS